MEQPILSAFSNEVRLRLIVCLSRKSLNVAELIKNCGLSQSAVSQHLKKLRTAGVVTTKRRGKEVYYSLALPQAAGISQKLLEVIKLKK